MLIEGILSVLYDALSFLTAGISIPNLPTAVYTALQSFMGYLDMGIGILATYTHLPYLFALFGIVVAVDAGLLVYRFVMWVLRKIPMLGIS